MVEIVYIGTPKCGYPEIRTLYCCNQDAACIYSTPEIRVVY